LLPCNRLLVAVHAPLHALLTWESSVRFNVGLGRQCLFSSRALETLLSCRLKNLLLRHFSCSFLSPLHCLSRAWPVRIHWESKRPVLL
jgi:hypothetical protein